MCELEGAGCQRDLPGNPFELARSVVWICVAVQRLGQRPISLRNAHLFGKISVPRRLGECLKKMKGRWKTARVPRVHLMCDTFTAGYDGMFGDGGVRVHAPARTRPVAIIDRMPLDQLPDEELAARHRTADSAEREQ